MTRACIANSDHKDFRAYRPEVMALLEMFLQRMDKLLLDVHHSAAYLAHRVVMIAARQLVVRRTVAEVRGIDRA